MPIGAALGAAAVTAGGSALAASKNSKAIGKASDATSASNAQAVAAQREARNQNVELQQPFYNTGTAAMGQMNALLGMGNAAQTGGGTDWGAYLQANPDVAAGFNDPGVDHSRFTSPTEYAKYHYQNYGQAEGRQLPTAQPQGGGNVNAQAQAEQAYNQFKNYTGYTTRLAEGNNALNAGYAAGGTLQSGDALKAFAKYNQDYASNEFGQYVNLLGGQQQLGAGAANALSGVNTNYANAASNLAIANGQNISNTAVARANNSNALIQGIGGAITGAMGSFGGSSYGGGF